MHLICQSSSSPLANAPGDLLIEIGLWLDSRTDLLHLGLTVRHTSTALYRR